MNKLLYIFLIGAYLTVAQQVCAQNDSNVEHRPTRAERRAQREREKLEKRRLQQERLIEESYFIEQQEINKANAKADDSETTVYIFGVGTNFNDSTVYLTRITQLDSIRIDKKTGFLPNRAEFSLQLKQYLEGTLGLVNETTCIFFSPKRKKIAKYFYKLKKRYLDEGYRNMIMVDPEKFKFVVPSIFLVR